MLKRSKVLIVCLACVALSASLSLDSAAQAGNGLNFSIPGESNDSVSLRVASNGQAFLQLIDKAFNKDSPKTLNFMLSRFRGQRDHLVRVNFVNNKDTYNEKQKGPLVTLELDCSAITFIGPYKGVLIVKTDRNEPKFFNLSLQRDEPAWPKAATSGDEVLKVKADTNGHALISLVTGELGADPSHKVTLTLSDFISSEGAAAVTFASGEGVIKGKKGNNKLQKIKLPPDRASWVLDASQLKYGLSYTGTLNISSTQNNPILQLRLELIRELVRNAVLLAEPTSANVDVVCYNLLSAKCKPPLIDNIVLREQSGTHEVRGLSVTWGNLQDGAPLTFKKNELGLSLNENRIQNLWEIDSTDIADIGRRSIAPGDKTVFSIQLPELPIGEHKLPLRLLAMNAKDNQGTDVGVKITLRRPYVYPFLFLLVTMFFSYMITTGYQRLRKARDLEERIITLEKKPWLNNDHSNMLPIVRAKALLARSHEAMRRESSKWRPYFSTAVVDEVSKRLDWLEKQMPNLERLSALWNYWAPFNNNRFTMVQHRARKRLRSIANHMSQLKPEADITNDILEEMVKLENWKDIENLESGYWADLKNAMSQVKEYIKLDVFEQDEGKKASLEHDIGSLDDFLTKLESGIKSLEKLSQEVASNNPNAANAMIDACNLWKNLDQEMLNRLQTSLKEAVVHMKEFYDVGVHPVLNALEAFIENLKKQQNFWQVIDEIKDKIKPLSVVDNRQMEELERIKNEFSRLPNSKTVNSAHENAKELCTSDREIIRYLFLNLKPDLPLQSLNEAHNMDLRYFVPLKLILDLHKMDRKTELIKMVKEKIKSKIELNEADINKMFEKADDYVWEDLNRVNDKSKIETPRGEIEAYELIDFQIMPDKNSISKYIERSFAFRYGFFYEWSIEFRQKGEPFKLVTREPIVTREPKVTQYIPLPYAEVKASVRVFRNNIDLKNHITIPITHEANRKDFTTCESKLLTRLHWLTWRGHLVFGIAFAIALITAIEADQFKAAVKGSWMAFATLFAWGVVANGIKDALSKFSTE